MSISLWMKNWLGQKKQASSKCLDVFDVKSMSQLLLHGLSLVEILQLLETDRNKDVFDVIRKEMKEGQTLNHIFLKVTPNEINKFLMVYLRMMPLSEALKHSLSLYERQKQLKDNLVKTLRYPLLLLLGTMIGFIIFSKLCMPMMMNVFSMFTTDVSLLYFQKGIQVLSLVLLFLLIVGLLVVSYYLHQDHQVQGYIALNRFKQGNLWTLSVSCNFAMYFNETLKAGCGTRETILLLQETQQVLVEFLSECVENLLMKGERLDKALKHPYLDEQLARFIVVGMQSGQLEVFLEQYVELAQGLIEKKAKFFTRLLQLVSYGLIGMVLIFIYQILLMPLSMLAQM